MGDSTHNFKDEGQAKYTSAVKYVEAEGKFSGVPVTIRYYRTNFSNPIQISDLISKLRTLGYEINSSNAFGTTHGGGGTIPLDAIALPVDKCKLEDGTNLCKIKQSCSGVGYNRISCELRRQGIIQPGARGGGKTAGPIRG